MTKGKWCESFLKIQHDSSLLIWLSLLDVVISVGYLILRVVCLCARVFHLSTKRRCSLRGPKEIDLRLWSRFHCCCCYSQYDDAFTICWYLSGDGLLWSLQLCICSELVFLMSYSLIGIGGVRYRQFRMLPNIAIIGGFRFRMHIRHIPRANATQVSNVTEASFRNRWYVIWER